MTTTIDKDLFDRLVHQNIDLSRYSAKQGRQLVTLLNRAEKDIVSQITAKDTWSQARLKALLKEIQLTIADVYKEASGQLSDEMAAFAPHAAELAAGNIAASMPLSWSPVAMSSAQYSAILSTTPIRIGTGQSLLYDEIFKGIAAGLESKVRGSIRLSMVEGESVYQAAARLQGKTGILAGSKRDIYNLAHTTIQHVNNQAAQITMQNNTDVVKGWIFISTFDSKVCSWCFSNSGKRFDLNSGPMPPIHTGCRCYQAPELRTLKELGFDRNETPSGTRATQSGQISADTSFNDWMKTQPKKTAIELLGPTRAKMFAEGKLRLDRFTDSSGKLLTLDQLKGK